MLSHDVYFTLHDDAPEATDRLVAACHKYLKEHPGVVFFAAGRLAGEFQRPVNDRDFHVALHVVFEDKAAHDTYQTSPDHLQFIEENKESWKQVRVFDAYVD
jgi:quinol monooxygenase YgiN